MVQLIYLHYAIFYCSYVFAADNINSVIKRIASLPAHHHLLQNASTSALEQINSCKPLLSAMSTPNDPCDTRQIKPAPIDLTPPLSCYKTASSTNISHIVPASTMSNTYSTCSTSMSHLNSRFCFSPIASSRTHINSSLSNIYGAPTLTNSYSAYNATTNTFSSHNLKPTLPNPPPPPRKYKMPPLYSAGQKVVLHSMGCNSMGVPSGRQWGVPASPAQDSSASNSEYGSQNLVWLTHADLQADLRANTDGSSVPYHSASQHNVSNSCRQAADNVSCHRSVRCDCNPLQMHGQWCFCVEFVYFD